jgi:hypothetical protein
MKEDKHLHPGREVSMTSNIVVYLRLAATHHLYENPDDEGIQTLLEEGLPTFESMCPVHSSRRRKLKKNVKFKLRPQDAVAMKRLLEVAVSIPGSLCSSVVSSLNWRLREMKDPDPVSLLAALADG